MDYVVANGLGGAMFWELSGDDASATLVDAIAAAELFLAQMEELAGAGPVPLKAFLAPQ